MSHWFNLDMHAHFSFVVCKQDQIIINKEKAKLRMRLHCTQLKLDAYRCRHKETLDEMDLMNEKYQAASENLKKKLASCGVENLKQRKEIAALRNTIEKLKTGRVSTD